MDAPKKLAGVVEKIFYANPDSPWMAGRLTTAEGDSHSFSGKIFAEIGNRVELTGDWKMHPKYGKQFEAETGIVKMDESPDALAHLLASHDDFSGIGKARSRKIVEAAMHLDPDDFGYALCTYPEEIASRANVSIDIIRNAAEIWREEKEYFDALAALADQGWSNAQAMQIVRLLGEGAPALVKADPYMLIGKIKRFGFRTVDAVARNLGVSSTDPMRLQSGIVYCLDQLSNNGNTYTDRNGIVGEAIEELRPDTLDGEDLIHKALEDLIAQGLVHLDESPLGNEIVADAALARIEARVFERLVEGLADDRLGEVAISDDVSETFESLNEGQAAAVRGFSRYRVTVLSGGAGVGKTYTTKAIEEVARADRLRTALCAPTGKAARRLEQSTGRPAKTIHRLLEPTFDEKTGSFRFTRNYDNPIDYELVIVDEVSMVDVRLMSHLLDALPDRCRLLLVGDHHQIPSVGPGAILRDLLAARDRYPEAVHVLTEIVRQAGILARNTSAILDGIVVSKNEGAWCIKRTEKGHEEGAAAIVASIVERIATSPEPFEIFGRHLNFDWDIQVLSPMKNGPLGTYNLNVHLQRLRQRLIGNPDPEPTPKGKPPKPLLGDRIIWTQNDYELDLFNGTQAIVVGFPKGGAMDLFTEDGREVTIPSGKRKHVAVAYAMTVHKSQGSEWPFVVLVGSSVHWRMHDRNLFYTGASRSSESLMIVGDRTGMQHFAREQKSAARQTFGSLIVHGWRMRDPQDRGLRLVTSTSGDESVVD